MSHRLLSLFSLVALLGLAAPSRAETCGNLAAHGACQDAKTLLFCQDGALQTLRCGAGEICAHNERFNGAAGCIATRYTGCGAVTDLGECAGDVLVYCANDTVEELVCPEGTACTAQPGPDGLEHDCVPLGLVPAPNFEPDPVEPGDDDIDIDEPSPIETNTSTPGPSIEQGGAPAEDYSVGGAGCAGSAAGLWALVAFAGLRRLMR